jgi:hypothetical protein
MTDQDDREELLAQLEHLKSLAEKAYGDMYETGSPSGATACYSEAKECLHDAIRVATQLGLGEQVDDLNHRLDHIKAVFRSQFC